MDNHEYVRICTYMHVYVCVCISTYMHVYVRICTYGNIYTYVNVFPAMTPYDTGIHDTSPKHSPSGQQPLGPTQGNPGHLGLHLFPS